MIQGYEAIQMNNKSALFDLTLTEVQHMFEMSFKNVGSTLWIKD